MFQSRSNLSCSSISVHMNVWLRFWWQKINFYSSQSIAVVDKRPSNSWAGNTQLSSVTDTLSGLGCETNSVSLSLLSRKRQSVIHSKCVALSSADKEAGGEQAEIMRLRDQSYIGQTGSSVHNACRRVENRSGSMISLNGGGDMAGRLRAADQEKVNINSLLARQSVCSVYNIASWIR